MLEGGGAVGGGGGWGRRRDREEPQRDRDGRSRNGIGRRARGDLAIGGGERLHLKFRGKLGFGSYLYEMTNFYRAAYRASKNRAVPRAGTMGQSGGPGTIDLSCRVGPKHYQSCLVPG
jgi:hypothetical protein